MRFEDKATSIVLVVLGVLVMLYGGVLCGLQMLAEKLRLRRLGATG